MWIRKIVSILIIMSKKNKKKSHSRHTKNTQTQKATKKNVFNTDSRIEARLNDIVPNVVNDYRLSITLCQEKRHLLGEDADPLSETIDNNIGFIGVFDGMGGSGATEYTLPDGTKQTGAYIASRLVCRSLQEFIGKNPQHDIESTQLQHYIKEQFDKYVVENNIKPSGLRSPIIRILPTTLSVIGYKQENHNIDIYSYWCGDSRNYILTQKGLMQISTDDLKSQQDPLENLRNDDALSNCICQDRAFTINRLHIEYQHLPIILLSATDGCFGYLPSPMHFENLLLGTLMQSNDIECWRNNIIETLKPISGDDFSMSVVMLGLTFEDWKKCLKSRWQDVQKKYIQPLEQKQKEIDRAQQKARDMLQSLYDMTTQLWNDYKTNYLNQ